jgi:hypothetical protein
MKVLSYDDPEQALEFQQYIELPVSVDAKSPLKGRLPSVLPTPIPPFRFRMMEAIRAVERHVFVEGLSDNPIPLVESAVAAFTWEFDTFWTVDALRDAYYPKMKALSLTIEHVARSGELIAEGIALQFLEQRLGVSRALCRFIAPNGNKPRLDYEFTPIHGTILSTCYPGLPKMQVEVRSRKETDRLKSKDRTRLTKKKKGKPKGHTLAIYCCYGEPTTKFSPQIILADPDGPPDIATEEDASDAALINYERITGRIGLWYHNALIRSEIRTRRIDVVLPSQLYEQQIAPPRPPLSSRSSGGRRYRGRDFSDRILEAELGIESAQAALLRIDRGDLGVLTFHGLNSVALERIEEGDWHGLTRFLDDSHSEDAVITGDGVYRKTARVVAGSPEADEILNVVRRRAGRS